MYKTSLRSGSAKFNGSSGSSEQDADREPASAATAAYHPVSSSAATHISGAMLKNSDCRELVQAFNLCSWKMTAILDAILNL